MKEIDISEFTSFAKALHCPNRWKIVDCLRTGPKSSDELFEFLKEARKQMKECSEKGNGACQDQNLKALNKPAFYYHLRALEDAGIIALHEYRPTENRKAPEKVWKLKIDKFFVKYTD